MKKILSYSIGFLPGKMLPVFGSLPTSSIFCKCHWSAIFEPSCLTVTLYMLEISSIRRMVMGFFCPASMLSPFWSIVFNLNWIQIATHYLWLTYFTKLLKIYKLRKLSCSWTEIGPTVFPLVPVSQISTRASVPAPNLSEVWTTPSKIDLISGATLDGSTGFSRGQNNCFVIK